MDPRPPSAGQLALPIAFLREPDRNFEKGGRSFYFFDFDDNVIHLATKIVLFHKESGEEHLVSTTEYAEIAGKIGNTSPYESLKIIGDDPVNGSYKNFREQSALGLDDQPLICDMKQALAHPFIEWRGPSWEFFLHAVNNNRPIAVITARGHHPHTIRRAIDMLVLSRDLQAHPNFLSVYPVTYPEIRKSLGDTNDSWSTAELKKAAIKRAIQDAFECYGLNPHHRFGMSDDDPSNVELIREAMSEVKQERPDNAFFVINTFERGLNKEEVFAKGSDPQNAKKQIPGQMQLFEI